MPEKMETRSMFEIREKDENTAIDRAIKRVVDDETKDVARLAALGNSDYIYKRDTLPAIKFSDLCRLVMEESKRGYGVKRTAELLECSEYVVTKIKAQFTERYQRGIDAFIEENIPQMLVTLNELMFDKDSKVRLEAVKFLTKGLVEKLANGTGDKPIMKDITLESVRAEIVDSASKAADEQMRKWQQRMKKISNDK